MIAAGESVNFSWDASGCIENATLTVGGKTFHGGTSATWNGTDADDQMLEPKKYTAKLSVSDGCCRSDQTTTVTVLPPPKICPISFKSSVNLATGSLLQSETLFAAKGGSFAAGVTLTYESLDPRIGPLGAKWSHNYDLSLTRNEDGTVTYRERNTRSFYDLVSGAFVPETGDYSTLIKNADNTYTITYQDGAKKMFAASGQITAMTDLNGNLLVFTYDVSGNLVSVVDASGRIIVFTYDANNRLSTLTDPAGKNYSFSYSGNSLGVVTWPDGSHWQYAYDAKGFMLSKTDPLGNLTTYAYDEKHRVTQGSDSSGSVGVANPIGISAVKYSDLVEQDGGVWNYAYDSHSGVLLQKVDPQGNATSYTYDANRNLIKEIAPDGSATRYNFDAAGNVLSMTDALGSVTTHTYNSKGQMTSTTDPLGRTTVSSYDDKGKLTQTVDPISAKTTYLYDAKGNQVRVTNVLGQARTFTYDAAGNQTSSTDPSGATTTFSYDVMGNLLGKADALGNITSYEYDDRYRLSGVTDSMGSATSYAYDFRGNKTGETDANGNITRYEYDDQGRLVKTVDALGSATTYSYRATGCASCGGGTDKITSLTDAKGQATSYQYDTLGRLTQETDPLGISTVYLYDKVGNLSVKIDANGATITYTYDALKRLTTKTYPDGSSASYVYDAAGRILYASNGNVAYTYAYDAAGRVTAVSDSRGYVIAYSYDLLGNRKTMTLQPGTADERVTSYAYDAAGHLTGITSDAGTFTYGYDILGRRASLDYPNQIIANYSYDSAGQLIGLNHGGVASFAYTLDRVGNRIEKKHVEKEQYFYDVIYRLLTIASATPESFSFDAVGNRLTGPSAKDTSYLYNAGNQMLKGRTLTYGYDNNGNQVGRAILAASCKSWKEEWGYENRLEKVGKVKGAERRIVSFSYDPMGRRIKKQIATVIDGVTEILTYNYVYDSDAIVLEIMTSSVGPTKTFFTHGAGIGSSLFRVGNGMTVAIS